MMSLRIWLLAALSASAAASLSVQAQTSADGLPAGPAKDLFVMRCSQCHTIESVTDKRKSESDWRMSVTQMASYGVNLTPDEEDAIVNYLAQNFGLKPVKKIT
jgi:competence protein ComEA